MRNGLGMVSAACLALAMTACEKPPPERVEVVRPVKVHVIGSLVPEAYREYPGTIRAFQHADMGFEVPGRVSEFLVTEGQRVDKGAILARLDARDYASVRKAAEAELKKAQADLARSTSIFKQDPGAISRQTIDQDRRAVEVARAQLEVQSKGLEDTELRAPFAGRVARKLVEDFANVQAKEPVLILQDNSILEIEVNVPERDVVVRRQVEGEDAERARRITERLKPEIIVSALPDRSFPARLKEAATQADPVTRTFPVRLNFENPSDVNVLPGMTAKVRVLLDPDLAASIPATAAQDDGAGSPYVWKIDPQSMTVSKAPVELADVSGDRVTVVSGLSEGDQVAVSGVMALREGMKVRKYEP